MSLDWKKDAIADKGGVYGISVRKVQPDGSQLSPTPDTYHSLGYIKSVKPRDITEQTKKYDEVKRLVAVLDQTRDAGFDAILMQSDMDILNFLRKDSRGNYYSVYRDNGIVNGKHQEIFYGICRISPKYEFDSTDKEIPITVECVANESALTIASGILPSECHNSDDVTIAANDYYEIAETPVS